MAVSDPVARGIVANLARLGGNITGVSNFLSSTTANVIELLKTIAPDLARFVLHNPENAGKMPELQELKIGGQASDVIIEPIEARSAEDLERLLSMRSHFGCGAATLGRLRSSQVSLSVVATGRAVGVAWVEGYQISAARDAVGD